MVLVVVRQEVGSEPAPGSGGHALVTQDGGHQHGEVPAVADQLTLVGASFGERPIIQRKEARQLCLHATQLHLGLPFVRELHTVALSPEDMQHHALDDPAEVADISRQAIERIGVSARIRDGTLRRIVAQHIQLI